MKTDIFIDLEGIGISFGVPTSVSKIELIATQLPRALSAENYEIASVTGFACHDRPPEVLPHKIKGVLRKVSEVYGWKIVWSSTIADLALIRAIETRLTKSTLSESVMIIAGQILQTGRSTIVSGTSMSRRLRKIAHRAIDLWEFLGENPEKIDWKRYEATHATVPALNPVKFPEIDFGTVQQKV